MTLFHVLIGAFWVFAGLMLARFLGSFWGIVGYLLGFVSGFLGAVVLVWAILRLGHKLVYPKQSH